MTTSATEVRASATTIVTVRGDGVGNELAVGVDPTMESVSDLRTEVPDCFGREVLPNRVECAQVSFVISTDGDDNRGAFVWDFDQSTVDDSSTVVEHVTKVYRKRKVRVRR